MRIKKFLKILEEFYNKIGKTGSCAKYYAQKGTFSWELHDLEQFCFTGSSTVLESEVYHNWTNDPEIRKKIISDIKNVSKKFANGDYSEFVWVPVLPATHIELDINSLIYKPLKIRKEHTNIEALVPWFYKESLCQRWCKINKYEGPWIWPGPDIRK